ncbi:bifunctional DNA primase/polymerase [Nonomuraea sp. NPDC049400]|uniref:bifunctional DNA primase/polymerase n=1 Tax=Nonomuraea sp. NPDC049400 TaxID=3364352 RepID=UPI0037874506
MESPPPASLAIARWCAEQGWPVHPLAPGRKTPAGNCSACQADSHTPDNCACLPARWCHGFHAATRDEHLIEAWWRSNPGFGVGVACGPANLLVIDIDTHPKVVPTRDRVLPGILIDERIDLTGLAHGHHTLGLLAALRSQPNPADDTDTLRVRTPSGGLHVWYRTDPVTTWLCSSGSSPARALAWQIDIRATGGYIVAPGTRTSAGTYTILGECRQPAPLPDWLVQELARTGHLRSDAPPASSPSHPPARALQAVIAAGGEHNALSRTLEKLLAEVLACAAVPEGAGFADKLNRAAYTIGGLVAAQYLSESDARNLLYEAAGRARPNQDRRCAAIIGSALAAGSRRPLHLRGRA